MKRYWILKSEPSTFSVMDLANSPHKTTRWDGVRNYQVRNMMRQEMHPGDEAFFYHSSCADPGIVGRVRIVTEAYPDPSAFDQNSRYYDPKSDATNPRWYAIDVALLETFPTTLTLSALRAQPALSDLLILRRGNRLSITPITPDDWRVLLALAAR
jgi:predicted RNA-binding protein with PUA-like domain